MTQFSAISAFPLDAMIGTETQANDYKTALGELISDRGGMRVQGTTEYGNGVTCQVSASKVHSGPCCSCSLEWRLHHPSQPAHLQERFDNSFKRRLSMNLLRYDCIWRVARTSGTPKSSDTSTRSDQELCSMHAKQQSGAFGTLSGSKSDGKRG